MNRKGSLSVVLIVKNEAKNIRDCLESVSWADEIVVLDSGSTDETLKIAKQYTDLVSSELTRLFFWFLIKLNT